MKKRLFGLVLTLLPLLAQADPVLINEIYYNLNGTEAEVTNKAGGDGDDDAISNSYSEDVSIPKYIEYHYSTYRVTSIGKKAFYKCSNLKSVTIGDMVTSIGEWAFAYCSDLTSVTIGDEVTSIGDYAFYSCSNLKSVTIPNSVNFIGVWVFAYCGSLTSMTIPNSVKESWIRGTFFRCSSLTSVTIGNGVRGIGEWTFGGCSSLTSVTLGNSVTFIGSDAFNGCSSLPSMTIPNSVTAISEKAFANCSSLTSITIPNGVTSIAEKAFYGCTGLTTITVSSGNTEYDSRDNCNAIIKTNNNTLVAGCKKTVIPNSVTTIGRYAFAGLTNMTSVNIPNSVTTFGVGAFDGCTAMTSINIPNSVTTIDYWAFDGCTSLTSVTIPSSVTSIGSGAFEYCINLPSVTIPSSVTSIGEQVFYGCDNLTTVSVFWTTPMVIGYEVFTNSANATLYVPKGSKSAYENTYFWSEFGSIVEIDFEKQILFADDKVRKLCVNRYWDTDSNGWLSYEEAAAVTKLDEVFTYDEDITSFDELQYFTGLTSISRSAFCECRSLTSVIIPNTVTEIGPHAFIDCSSLASVTIPEGVTIIYYSAFDGCSSLTSVTIPNSVTEICDDAFSDCSSLTSVTIGSGVTSIGEGTFAKCSSLTDVYCYAENVPSTDSYVFYNTDIQSATLHVPASALDAYSYTAPWSEFGSKVALDDNSVATGIMDVADVPVRVKSRGGIITVEGIDNRTPVSVYTMDGMLAGTGTTTDRTATISTSLTPGTPVIVKMGGKAVKTIVR